MESIMPGPRGGLYHIRKFRNLYDRYWRLKHAAYREREKVRRQADRDRAKAMHHEA